MAAWFGRGWIDLGLRAAGAALASIAAGAASLLRSLTLAHPGRPALAEFAAAAILFLCGSIGAALIFTGARLLDRVEVAGRWRRTGSSGAPPGPTAGGS